MKEKRIGRRGFIEGLAAGGVLTACGLLVPPRPAYGTELAGAQSGPQLIPGAVPQSVPQRGTLSGTEFHLTIGRHAVNFTGRRRSAVLINDSLPAPLLRWREGDTVTLHVHNTLDEDTSIHWHGMLLPANMDGVPGISFPGIAPGETFTYRFRVRQNGTYWYHSHSGFQEQLGMYGPIIIDPAQPEPFTADREHVVLLSDWTDMDPYRLFDRLRKDSHYFNRNPRTLGDFVRDSRRDGFGAAIRDRLAWARMRMDPTDLADVGGHAYTYLMNGVTPAANWTGLFRPGERVRLRFINASAMTYFDVRIPGLKMTAVAADGQYVRPVTGDEFRLAVAETLDVIVEPDGEQAYTIFAQSMDRSGYARGTLAVAAGLEAQVPSVDRIQLLTHADMGHDHAGMDHGNISHSGTDHSQHDAHDADHDHSRQDHSNHDDHGADDVHSAHAPQWHPPTEYRNPGMDMRAESPQPRLDDPGVGLRNNGREVLTYARLASLFDDPDGREPGRTLEVHLTGHMGRFIWSFDGVRFQDAEPIRLRYGERVRIVFVNDTMMDHPIHLHGMWSDLEDEQGRFHLRKHTVNVAAGTRRAIRVTADALGRWAFHCHLLYHMEAGMFREVRVEE
jgi:CopA family copper-resistance protein